MDISVCCLCSILDVVACQELSFWLLHFCGAQEHHHFGHQNQSSSTPLVDYACLLALARPVESVEGKTYSPASERQKENILTAHAHEHQGCSRRIPCLWTHASFRLGARAWPCLPQPRSVECYHHYASQIQQGSQAELQLLAPSVLVRHLGEGILHPSSPMGTSRVGGECNIGFCQHLSLQVPYPSTSCF